MTESEVGKDCFERVSLGHDMTRTLVNSHMNCCSWGYLHNTEPITIPSRSAQGLLTVNDVCLCVCGGGNMGWGGVGTPFSSVV